MVGPNPYPLHSFRELRAAMGRPYIVCRPCRRFVPLGCGLDGRDSRSTTFSCSVCGGAGAVVFDDPAKEGLQHDPRPNPPRHQLAALRLQQFHQLADPFGHRPAAREALPQRERPRHEPEPRYHLVPLPIRTFGEALDFGLALRIHCPGCHEWRPVELTAEQLDLPFAGGTRFICSHVKRKRYGDGTEVCGAAGDLVFGPIEKGDADRTVVDIQCGGRRRHPHPLWEIAGVDLKSPPWAGRLGDNERFRCPGCGGMPRHTYHVPYPHKPSAIRNTATSATSAEPTF